MKKILVTAILLLMASIASASPYLVCDPIPATNATAAVEAFVISEVSKTDITVPAQADFTLKYDLAGVTDGMHTWSVKACNIWGCSATSPFGFTKSLPVPVGNLRIK